MARDTSPTYVIEMTVPGYRYSPAPWNCRRDGRPTAANLAKHVASFEASTQPGQCNAHLGATRVASAKIRRNMLAGDTVATYTAKPAPAAPLFVAIA
jgi:hypothetical protein